MYSVKYTSMALKKLKKMDKHVSGMIVSWIKKNLSGCDEPRNFGKGLTANRSGEWRYRVGDYRIIADIQESLVTILILDVGDRKEIYKKK